MKKLNLLFLSFLVLNCLTFSLAQETFLKSLEPMGLVTAFTVSFQDEFYFAATQLNDGGAGKGYNILRTDSHASKLWVKHFGEMYIDKKIVDMKPLSDRSIVIVVTENNPYPPYQTQSLLIKLNSNGDSIWGKKLLISPPYSLTPSSVTSTADSGFIISGQRRGNMEAAQAFIMKVNSKGDSLWSKFYKLGNDGDDGANFVSVNETVDSCFIAMGSYNIFTPGYRSYPAAVILKINKNGEVVWQKIYGGVNNYAFITDLFITKDNNFVFLLRGQNNLTVGKYVNLIKMNLNGDTIFAKQIIDFDATRLCLLGDGGLLLARSEVNKGIYSLKLDSDAAVLWENNYKLSGELISILKINETNDKGIVFGGYRALNTNTYPFILKTDMNGVLTDVEETKYMVNNFGLKQNYPNPFNPSTVINYELKTAGFVTLKVYDILGREVATLVNGYQNQGTHKVNFNASSLASGIYIYRIQAGDKFSESKKMILMR